MVHLVSQDLSVAGKRAGISGERSGLFMEQIRIIKEMRAATGGECPRFMVWENVPGALSSNEGEDFRVVLEETAKIKDSNAVIPRPPKKWTKSGAIMGDGWSIAWRVHDAQFWGVPQRRKRIALVADFAGGGAPEILFERQGMSGDSQEGTGEGEDVAADFREGTDCTSECKPISFQERAGKSGGGEGILIQYDHVGALVANNNQMVLSPLVLNDQGEKIMNVTEDVVSTLRAQEHGHQPIVFEPGAMSRVGGHVYEDGIAGTLRADPGDNQQVIAVAMHATPKVDENGVAFTMNNRDYKDPQAVAYCKIEYSDTVGALCARDYKGACNQYVGEDKLIVEKAFALQSFGEYKASEVSSPLKYQDYKDATDLIVMTEDGDNSCNYVALENHPNDSRIKISEDDVIQTLSTRMGTGGGNIPLIMQGCQTYVVRRLTPLECERLQGYPDGWTDIGEWVDNKGKKHKDADTPRYKALGNSIALPFWEWMAERMMAQFERTRPITMGSLFDGIGGFPLAFSCCEALPVWASEIEEFCVAVTKKHFGENE